MFSIKLKKVHDEVIIKKIYIRNVTHKCSYSTWGHTASPRPCVMGRYKRYVSKNALGVMYITPQTFDFATNGVVAMKMGMLWGYPLRVLL